MKSDCITYHINDEDKIVYLSEEWGSFANENMAGILSAGNVLNKSIYEFIADDNSRQLYALLFQRVRNQPVSVQFPFRCDSPEKRRYMVMEIYPVENGLLALKSCIVREEIRQAVLLLDRNIERTAEYLKICGWCKKVDVNGVWMEAEPALKSLGLLGETRLPNLSHGMCDDCYENIRKELHLAGRH